MLRRAGLMLLFVGVMGCNAHVFSPPTGSFPVESSRTIAPGAHAVSGDVFAGGGLFGPEVVTARASYRQGVHDNLELSASPALIRVRGWEAGDSHPNIYALRFGAKYAPVKHFAVIGGAGGGASAAGGFISPDLGVIAAFENSYFVPLATLRGLLSVPVNPSSVHFSTEEESDADSDFEPEPANYRLTPKLTLGFQLAAGARVPLVYDDAARVKPSLACAAGITTLNDLSEDEGYFGGSCAVDVVF